MPRAMLLRLLLPGPGFILRANKSNLAPRFKLKSNSIVLYSATRDNLCGRHKALSARTPNALRRWGARVPRTVGLVFCGLDSFDTSAYADIAPSLCVHACTSIQEAAVSPLLLLLVLLLRLPLPGYLGTPIESRSRARSRWRWRSDGARCSHIAHAYVLSDDL